MIHVNELNLKCRQSVAALKDVEGIFVPETLEDMLTIYGNRYSDENQVRRRAEDNNGDGSDALHWGFPMYAGKWVMDRKVVLEMLGRDIANTPQSQQLQLIDEAWQKHDRLLTEKWDTDRKLMGKDEDGKPIHDPWFDMIPTKYVDASLDDFPNAFDKYEHIAGGGSMLMLGSTGVGKTRFIWAVAKQLVDNTGDSDQVKVITLQEMLAKVRSSPGDWTEEVLRRYGQCIWLFVDECDKVNGNENDYIIASALVNKRYEWGLSTVFAGNGDRDSIIAKLGEPVVSRLTAGNEKGKLFRVTGKDRRTM